ncbi:hypothetical protein HYN69_08805 [Gemmobacter aquarius]|uniref:UDP:flavonoid glycosyltransferase YjiC, YdhE family n=1 Tax=Paragemmobacter aquarius TaxID=2169400 RepID=A0A2S0UL95_9RHOB|nr:nucleotide disphospho-sugar-binding domain-containing protein [Gemmobacter aquarius]AWB48594.1 hypothetical protein HYN69_08805 [Gemmobacter aquarius]
MTKNVLLANEFGIGRGHIVQLLQTALALGPGFTFEAALYNRSFAAELAPLGALVYDGPGYVYDASRRTGPKSATTATWGEFLGDLGFSQRDRVRDIVMWWHNVLGQRRIDLLVADYAPLALLAARARGIPTIAVGQGYGLPPDHLSQFPPLHAGPLSRLHDEEALLDNVNAAASGIGLAPLAGLPQVYQSTLPMVRTLPFLDAYQGHRRFPYVLPKIPTTNTIAANGDEVFIYFSTQELNDPQVVDALASLPLPRRAFLPTASPETAARLAASGIIVETQPVPADLIAARSRLMVHSGQHGTLCLGLFAGLPQVAFPQHMEQSHHADAVAAQGTARVIGRASRSRDHITDTIQSLWSDAEMARKAQDLARSLRQTYVIDADEAARTWLKPLRDTVMFT